jgi:hypothetical protein
VIAIIETCLSSPSYERDSANCTELESVCQDNAANSIINERIPSGSSGQERSFISDS